MPKTALKVYFFGKKSHDPREYDPLTQADSDESEDDLVINIQQNGVQNGKGNRGGSQDRDSDVEGISKRVQQRPVDSKQDGLSAAGSLDPELTPPTSLISYVRTTVFLLTVVVSMVMVLVCAFLIPCPMNGQHNMWTLHVGYDTEFSSPLELFDVNQDGVPDILLTFLSSRINASKDAVKQRPFLSVLSGLSGSAVWSRPTQENLRSIQCGQLVIKQNDTCLLTGTYKLLSLITASTGEPLWTMNFNHVSSGTIAAPAVILPDLDDDFTNDLLVLTIGESQPDLGFLLISGRTGNPLGAIVKYSIMGEGKLLGPQAYYTSQGAIYILFGFGNIQALALKDIYDQANIGDHFPSAIQRIDPVWEKRSVNHSKLINVYSAGVEFLQTVPVYLSNFSDLLVTTKDALALLSGHDLEQRWSINLNNIYSHPKPGYFNSDGNLDFFIQIQSNTTEKKVIVIDGVTSGSLWESEIPWHEHDKEAEAMSLLTADGKSVFLFWGEALVSGNSSQMPYRKSDVPRVRHLYLLCPTYPGVVLDLFNVSSSIVASAVGIRELEKDALLAIMTAEQEQSSPGIMSQNLTVTKVGMRWALTSSRAVSLRGANIRPKVEDIRKILTRLKFSSLPLRVLKS